MLNPVKIDEDVCQRPNGGFDQPGIPFGQIKPAREKRVQPEAEHVKPRA